jgi:xanthine/uracil permease
MLFISGITTILHSYFGTRLPLVQGSSFVYLAPALVIINAQDYRNLTEHVSSYFINKHIILIRQILKVLNPGYFNCRNLGT